MNLLISRKKNAELISENILKDALREYPDGWGICYFDDERKKSFVYKNLNNNEKVLINKCNFLHQKNFSFVLSFHKFKNDDYKHIYNIQPFINNAGVLFINEVSDPNGKEAFHNNEDKLKTSEYIFSELFNIHYEITKDKSKVWDKFITEEKKDLEYLNNKPMLYINPEDFKIMGINLLSNETQMNEDNTLWISNILTTQDNSEILDSIITKFEELQEVLISELRPLSDKELLMLLNDYPDEMAEIILDGKTSDYFDNRYESKDIPLINFEEEDEEEDVESIYQCEECLDLFPTSELIEYECSNGDIEYQCLECCDLNGEIPQEYLDGKQHIKKFM